MGNVKSLETLPVAHPANEEEWKIVENLGYCDVVRNSNTNELLEQYTIPVDGRLSLPEEFQRYEFRRTQTQNLVRVIQVQKQDSKYLCSGMDFLRVRTERIPVRLSELKNVPLNESLYILQEALIGFKTICEKAGPVRITNELVCFDTEGRVKVWLNEHLAKNTPEEPLKIQQTVDKPSQQTMLAELLRLVEEHSVGQQYPPALKQRLQAAGASRFTDIMELLRMYIQQERVQVSTRIRLPKLGRTPSQQEAPSIINQPSNINRTQPPPQQMQNQASSHTSQVQQSQPSNQPPQLQQTIQPRPNSRDGGMPMLQVPTKPPEYLDQALVKLFEQAQKAAAADSNYHASLTSAYDSKVDNTIPQLIINIVDLPPPPPEVTNATPAVQPSVQSAVQPQPVRPVDIPNQMSQTQPTRSDSKEKRNVGTPRKPPLPPSSKEALSASKSAATIEQAQPVAATGPVQVVSNPSDPRTFPTPIQVTPPHPFVINANRPASGHGAPIQIDRPGSAHGVVKTVLPLHGPGVQVGHIVSPPSTTFVQHVPHFQPHPITTVGPVISNHGAPVIEIRPGRIGIDTRIGVVHHPQHLPQQFRGPATTADGIIKQQTAINLASHQQPQTELKKELSVERLKNLLNVNPGSATSPKPQSPVPYRQGQPFNRTAIVAPTAPQTSMPNILSNNSFTNQPLNSQPIVIPPPSPVPPADPNKPAQQAPFQQQPQINQLNPNIPGQLYAQQPAVTYQTAAGTAFSGGIRILNNRMLVTPREPIPK